MVHAARPISTPSRHVRGKALIAAACALAFLLSGTSAADAAVFRYNVLNVSKKGGVVGGVISSCKITTTGGTCTISRGKTATRTVDVTMGATKAEVSAQLKIGSSSSVTTTVGCTSPALKAGQTWRARAMGTEYTYKLQQQQAHRSRVGRLNWITVGTSGKLKAFDPSKSDIACGL